MVDDDDLLSRAGTPYTDKEIEDLFLLSLEDDARKPANLERVARVFKRTTGAIDMVFRWCQGADFPERANNRIRRQVMAVRKKYGLDV